MSDSDVAQLVEAEAAKVKTASLLQKQHKTTANIEARLSALEATVATELTSQSALLTALCEAVRELGNSVASNTSV